MNISVSNALRIARRRKGAIFGAFLLILWPSISSGKPEYPRYFANSIKAYLSRTIGCRWQGNHDHTTCKVKALVGSINLDVRHEDQNISNVQIYALVSGHPARPIDQARSRATVVHVIKCLFPVWRNGKGWMTAALAWARHEDATSETVVSGFRITVNWLQPVDTADAYAEIIITPNK